VRLALATLARKFLIYKNYSDLQAGVADFK
jgi:hypothetical protein